MMMKSWFASTKGAVLKTKLDAEIALLDRDIAAHQKAFGLEFYSLLVDKQNEIIPLPQSIFKESESSINDVVKNYQGQVGALVHQWHNKRDQIRVMKEDHQAAAPRAVTPTDKFNLATKWASDSGTAMNVRLEMNSLEDKIRKCKEEFGIEVWMFVSGIDLTSPEAPPPAERSPSQLNGLATAASAAGESISKSAIGRRVRLGVKSASKRYLGKDVTKEIGSSTKSSASDHVSDLSEDDRKIYECMKEAQKEIGYLEERVKKLRQERSELSAPSDLNGMSVPSELNGM